LSELAGSRPALCDCQLQNIRNPAQVTAGAQKSRAVAMGVVQMSEKIAHFPLDFGAEESVCGGARINVRTSLCMRISLLTGKKTGKITVFAVQTRCANQKTLHFPGQTVAIP
jgi:hypothetical protein